MSEFYVSPTATHSIVSPHLAYSTILGIKSSPEFSCRNYTEDNYVLIYVTHGCLFVEQHQQSFILHPDEYLLLDKKILHSYYFDASIPSQIHWMHINGHQINNLIQYISTLTPLPFIGKNTQILDVIDQCLLMHRQGDINPFQHATNIFHALNIILEDIHHLKQRNRYSTAELSFRTRIDDILSHTPLSQITLEYLCDQMYMNKYYFSHLFKTYYSISPIKYVNQMKMERAKYLLRYTDLKITTIATECGYSSPAYFTAAFHNEYGLPPKEYRLSDLL